MYLWVRGGTVIQYAWNGGSNWGIHYRSRKLDPIAQALLSGLKREGPTPSTTAQMSGDQSVRGAEAEARARWPGVDVDAARETMSTMLDRWFSGVMTDDYPAAVVYEAADEETAECLEFLLARGNEAVSPGSEVTARIVRVGRRITLDIGVDS